MGIPLMGSGLYADKLAAPTETGELVPFVRGFHIASTVGRSGHACRCALALRCGIGAREGEGWEARG
jgi:hypothetical protein